MALAYARAPRETAGLVRAWNVFGILDLVVAVTTGFLTAPSLIQPFEFHPPSELMTVLPMVLIPVYLVPLSIVLHIASLAKLHRATCAGKRQADGGARRDFGISRDLASRLLARRGAAAYCRSDLGFRRRRRMGLARS